MGDIGIGGPENDRYENGEGDVKRLSRLPHRIEKDRIFFSL
jgi:hypothetical protein